MAAVTKETVRGAIIRLQANGEEPTNVKIRAVLTKGSFAQITPLRQEVLDELKAARAAGELVPSDLRARFEWSLIDLWESARAQAERRAKGDRAEADAAEKRATEWADGLVSEVAALRQRLGEVEAILVDRTAQLKASIESEREAVLEERETRRRWDQAAKALSAAQDQIAALEHAQVQADEQLLALIARVPQSERVTFGEADTPPPFVPILP